MCQANYAIHQDNINSGEVRSGHVRLTHRQITLLGGFTRRLICISILLFFFFENRCVFFYSALCFLTFSPVRPVMLLESEFMLL